MTPQELTDRLADNPDIAIVGEFTAVTETPRRHKYNAVATEVDGILFPSKAEAARYSQLRLLEQDGQISGLELQPRYPLVVEGVKVGEYRGDFKYRDENGREVVEDVKSNPTKTAVYRLKKKLVKALHGIEIKEVK